MALELPSRDAAAYLRRFNAAALFVVAPPTGVPSQPGAGVDLSDALARIRKIWPRESTPQPSAAWWVPGINAGQSVLNLALGNDLRGVKLERGRLPLPASVVAAALVEAAKRLGIPLTSYQVGLDRVREARATLSAKLDNVQTNGELKKFNTLYKQARLLAEKENRRFPNYSTARARLVAAVAACAASGAPIDFAKIFEDPT